MKTEAKHTPTPWKVDGFTDNHDVEIVDHDGGLLVIVYGDDNDIQNPLFHPVSANAAFIVQACNAHDQLVAALEYAENELEHLKSGHLATHNVIIGLDIIRAALLKAREVTHGV